MEHNSSLTRTRHIRKVFDAAHIPDVIIIIRVIIRNRNHVRRLILTLRGGRRAITDAPLGHLEILQRGNCIGRRGQPHISQGVGTLKCILKQRRNANRPTVLRRRFIAYHKLPHRTGKRHISTVHRVNPLFAAILLILRGKSR